MYILFVNTFSVLKKCETKFILLNKIRLIAALHFMMWNIVPNRFLHPSFVRSLCDMLRATWLSPHARDFMYDNEPGWVVELLLLSFRFTTSIIFKTSRRVLCNEWEISRELLIIKYILKKILQIASLNKHSNYVDVGFEKDMINENMF